MAFSGSKERQVEPLGNSMTARTDIHKAGSGKSTLMKYVCGHGTTLEALRFWAGSRRLVTASYYFWNAGLPMQKSQLGLLQSLLYQVLRACPGLIQEIFPTCRRDQPWTQKEISEALDKVSSQTLLPAKFCFFVDGLDEYEGDDEDIVHLLHCLAACPSIKICVSSRPWNAFLDAFDDSNQKLVIEDLTKEDMRQYVRDMLVKDKAFVKFAEQDGRCNGLVPQIADKAHGVWLWVYLVVRDLLRDLTGEEGYCFLQRRLDNFPDELEKYFEDIICRIDKIHRQETARIFLVALTSSWPLPVLAFEYLSREAEDPEYAVTAEIVPLSSNDAAITFGRWRKLLDSRCRDLLEVNVKYDAEFVFAKYRDNFLHRTVRDFLRDNYQQELCRRAGDDFDARLSLCKIGLALIKATSAPPHSTGRYQLFGLVGVVLSYARDVDRRNGSATVALLDELYRVNREHAKVDLFQSNAGRPPQLHYPSDFGDSYRTFLALAVQAGLCLYVYEKVEANPGLLWQTPGRPLLDHALRPRRSFSLVVMAEGLPVTYSSLDLQMVSILLKLDSDPNWRVPPTEESVWVLFLEDCSRDASGAPADVVDRWYEAVQLLINHGADLHERFINRRLYPRIHSKPSLTASEMFEEIFSKDQAARLQARIKELTGLEQGQQSSVFRKVLGWTSTLRWRG